MWRPWRSSGGEPQGAWLTGWYQSSPLAVRIAPVDAIRVAGPDGSEPHLLAVSDRAAAGVWHQVAAASSIQIDPHAGRTALAW